MARKPESGKAGTRPRRSPWTWLVAGLFMAVSACGVAFGVYVVIDMVRGPQVGEHFPPADAPYHLPAEATDVCYVTAPPFWPAWAYEFSVPEEAFVKWARDRGCPVQEIGPKPFKINRYTFVAAPGTGNHQVSISSGLYYEVWDEPDSCVKIGYDRNRGRAYYWCQTR